MLNNISTGISTYDKLKRINEKHYIVEKFTISELVDGWVNLIDAKRNLGSYEYIFVETLFEEFKNDNNIIMISYNNLIDVMIKIISHFDMIAPYYKFCGMDDFPHNIEEEIEKNYYRNKAFKLLENGDLYSKEWKDLNHKFRKQYYNDDTNDYITNFYNEDVISNKKGYDENNILDNNKNNTYEVEEENDSETIMDDSDEDEIPMKNMLGMAINKENFANMQKMFCGFSSVDMFFNKEKYEELKQKKDGGELITLYDSCKLILPLIFGNFGCKIDLDRALLETKKLLKSVEKEKPKDNFTRESDQYTIWLRAFALPQLLLGTIYSYQNEYVKASYHFLTALKTEQLEINMPYCDFVKYILNKLPKLVKQNCSLSGCGYSANSPMGSCDGNILIADYAQMIIPEMEGKNGEILACHRGRVGMYGHLVRRGSTHSETTPHMIDIYETYVISKNYSIKKICFYFNGYFDSINKRIKVADGFSIKSHSAVKDYFTIEE